MNQPLRLDPVVMESVHKLNERGGDYGTPLPKKPGKHAGKTDAELTPQQRYERNSRPSYFERNREKCNATRAAWEKKHRAEDSVYLEKRRQQARDAQQRRRLAKKQLLYSVRNVPCIDCGVRLPPEIMDLDHVRGKKEFNLGGAAGSNVYRSIEAMKVEIAKCDVRCPNCHRLRHYNETRGARK